MAATADGVKDGGKEKMKGIKDEFTTEEIADLVKLLRSRQVTGHDLQGPHLLQVSRRVSSVRLLISSLR